MIKTYPFPSKRQIVARISADREFALSCLVVLYRNQTAYEQETKQTLNRNKRGFMSSHAVNGTKLAEKHLAGEILEPEETALAYEIVSHYGRQLARHLREDMVRQDPSLAEAARIFSAD